MVARGRSVAGELYAREPHLCGHNRTIHCHSIGTDRPEDGGKTYGLFLANYELKVEDERYIKQIVIDGVSGIFVGTKGFKVYLAPGLNRHQKEDVLRRVRREYADWAFEHSGDDQVTRARLLRTRS